MGGRTVLRSSCAQGFMMRANKIARRKFLFENALELFFSLCLYISTSQPFRPYIVIAQGSVTPLTDSDYDGELRQKDLQLIDGITV